jgi:single-stranded-DNA-specific exonuclease
MSLNLVSKVAGVTYEGRQDIIANLRGNEPCRLEPEPDNPYDPNAIKVIIALPDGTKAHVGYLPRDLAKQVAPELDGEKLMVKIIEITGGYGDFPIWGMRIAIRVE